MALTKLIYQDSNDDFNRAVAAHGDAFTSLIEYDRGVKSASSDLVSKKLLEEYRPTDKNTVCMHLIAMGDSDMYGYNRNGDYFAGDVLEKTAHTFVTNGHVFREHKNRDPKEAIGQVKWAGYDPKGMHRVELIIHMDRDKAEEEYEMAKKGSALNFSMSCKVPNDRCSICGNEAKNVKNYCDHLKYNMGRYVDGFHKYAFAYNDKPTFFDISRVKTPADRIARHLEYLFDDDKDMAKAASANDMLIPSAVMAEAEGVIIPDTLELDEMGMVYKMADAEENIDAFAKSASLTDTSFAANNLYKYALAEKFTPEELKDVRAIRPDHFFREMAKRASILSFPAFCQYITGDPNITEDNAIYKQACCLMPKVYRVMRIKVTKIIPVASEFRMGSASSADTDSPSIPSGDPVDKVMDKMEDKFSMEEKPLRTRVIIRITSRGKDEDDDDKEDKKKKDDSEDNEKAASLAETYAQYQMRALCDMKDLHGEDAISNSFCELLAGANRGTQFS